MLSQQHFDAIFDAASRAGWLKRENVRAFFILRSGFFSACFYSGMSAWIMSDLD